MRGHMKIAMENNPFGDDFNTYGAVFTQLEMLGYTHKEIKTLVNTKLEEKGIDYSFNKSTINHFISEHEVVAHIKGLVNKIVTKSEYDPNNWDCQGQIGERMKGDGAWE